MNHPKWNAVFSLAVGVASLNMAEFLPVGVLTPMAEELQITEGTAGQAVTATAMVAVVTSLTIAFVTRKVNRKKVLLGLSFLLICSNWIVAIAPDFVSLLAGRVLLGIAIGGFWSMAAATAMRLVPSSSVPRALSIIFGGSSFASVFAAPLGSFVGNLVGWRMMFLASGILALVAFVWQFLVLPSLQPTGQVKFGTIYHVLKKPQFAAGLLAVSFLFCGRFASFTYLRPFLERTTQVDVNGITAILFILGAAGFLGTSFAGPLIQRNLQRLLGGVPLILMLVALGLLTLGHSWVATAILVLIWGAVFGMMPVGWSTWVTRRVPEAAETAGGLLIAAIQFAAALGASGGGVAFDSTGSSGVFIGSAFSWFLSSAIVFLRLKPTPRMDP